jgi:hypothetical protein
MSALRFEFDMDPRLVINPLVLTEIVSSRTFLGGQWLAQTKHKLFNEPEVKKWFLPVDCSYWNLQVFTSVEARTVIPEHQHDEPVLRHILSGSMELNDEHLEAGDWVIVPANFRYRIQTRDGYSILSAYHDNCAECKWNSLSKMPLGKL